MSSTGESFGKGSRPNEEVLYEILQDLAIGLGGFILGYAICRLTDWYDRRQRLPVASELVEVV